MFYPRRKIIGLNGKSRSDDFSKETDNLDQQQKIYKSERKEKQQKRGLSYESPVNNNYNIQQNRNRQTQESFHQKQILFEIISNITKSVQIIYIHIYIYIFIFRSKIHGTVEQGDDSPHHQRPEKGKRATQQIY